MPARRTLLTALILTVISWSWVHLGVELGKANIPEGQGLPKPGELGAEYDLLRFDSFYYLAIAEDGYSYNGDPHSSPNIVFAPLFPWLVRAIGMVSFADFIPVGFGLNLVLLFGAFCFLLLTLEGWLGVWPTRLVLAALGTSAGSYALHAYYSESLMLFGLSVALYSSTRSRWLFALSMAGLGLSRVAALPVVIAGTLRLISQKQARWSEGLALAALALSGSALYLALIAVMFGNPFTLLPEIQQASWGLFHQPNTWLNLLTGKHLLGYLIAAFDRPLLDIRTLNLLWTLLGLGSALWLAFTREVRQQPWSWLFLAYAAFLYYQNTSSEFLISAHRFYLLMLPIFLMGAWLARRCGWWWSVPLLAINGALGLYHAAHFSRGTWYFF